jgi:hypothetical protein
MKIKSQRDFFSGLMFLALGIAFSWGATTLHVGRPTNMGPGYFPLVLGIVLASLGAFITFGALVLETEDGDPAGEWAWRPLGFVTLANVLFGASIAGVPALGLPPLGLAVSVAVLTFVASLAAGRLAWKEVVVLAVALAASCWLVFVLDLGLDLSMWPSFTTH